MDFDAILSSAISGIKLEKPREDKYEYYRNILITRSSIISIAKRGKKGGRAFKIAVFPWPARAHSGKIYYSARLVFVRQRKDIEWHHIKNFTIKVNLGSWIHKRMSLIPVPTFCYHVERHTEREQMAEYVSNNYASWFHDRPINDLDFTILLSGRTFIDFVDLMAEILNTEGLRHHLEFYSRETPTP